MPDSGIADGSSFTSAFWDAYVREQVVTTCTSATRPTAVEGRCIWETDTNQLLVHNGTAWVAVRGASGTWTPSLTATTTNPTLGTGSSVAGSYVYASSLLWCAFGVTFGTSGVAAGSGNYQVTGFPANPVSGRASFLAGRGRLSDSAGAVVAYLDIIVNDSGVATFRYQATWPTGTETYVTNSTPWTWNASDRLEGWVQYPTA